MSTPRPQLRVPRGLNYWRLLRTDRDGATPKSIPQNAAAAVRYFLGLGLSPRANQQLVPVAKNEWRFGDVRPLQVLDISRKAGGALPAGEVLADRVDSPTLKTIPTVSGKKPWWVVVRFWWRGTDQTIDYPGVRQGMLWPAWALNDADWVLDRAVFVPRDQAPADPGAATWTESLGDKAQSAFLRATDDLGDLLTGFGGSIGILALLYLLSQSRRR